VPSAPPGRRLTARHALIVVFLAGLLLVLFEGSSVRDAGEGMDPGLQRELVLAIGEPAGWVSDRLPFDEWTDDALAFLEDEGVGAEGGFDATAPSAGGRRAVPPVPPTSFDPAELGERAPATPDLETLLVTGDSMSTPLDAEMGRLLAGEGVRVIREPHLGTGISKSFLVDWGQLSARQVSRDHPDAIVVFIGANEGFPMPGPDRRPVQCCGADWASVYANRVRRMVDTYRQNGKGRIYWIGLPAPRAESRQRISRVVNQAVEVATQPWRRQARVIDTGAIFTPNGYRDAMTVNGTPTIVRQPDGIHLNENGSRLLATTLLEQLRRDFVY